ncbi:carbamoyl phosphate synthase small subunit [Clostridium oryzae]|uniref:Carbamoyl phosphate synthase small chain n=1 Tax=Clostridium oryzae TaxID=1450648 RepID=A0A1V4IQD3_9CLOT|nr:carbamoyl phosphate synthase small subunit [Clostridium oryzae]OPJ62113.1 carbamoyl-phosphate synthase small chain [Clostridium oryzae]
MKAKLILENGMVFEGNAFGYLDETIGEVVFNTGMTGYQEVLTDPSYYGQIVTMTYPLIGNYGLNLEDGESEGPKVKGFIVREACEEPNNFRCEITLNDYLKHHKIMGLEKIDTRALTKILRNSGTMKGIITVHDLSQEEIDIKFQNYNNTEAVKNVSTKEEYVIEGSGKHVAVIDYGIKANILRCFEQRNCKLTVFPATAKSEDILNVNPDLVFLSNGPGDPADLAEQIDTIKGIVGKKPMVGICLGHQLLALALGGKTAKLKFGHRGSNHPVKDLEDNRVYITLQNHGYYVKELPEGVKVTHVNLNDETIEGMRHEDLHIYSVQFHPEANPGPRDVNSIFDKFLAV